MGLRLHEALLPIFCIIVLNLSEKVECFYFATGVFEVDPEALYNLGDSLARYLLFEVENCRLLLRIFVF